MGYLYSVFRKISMLLFIILATLDPDYIIATIKIIFVTMYFLYKLRQHRTKSFLDVELNRNINFHWKKMIDILPSPCIICSYGRPELQYANKSALANLAFIDSTISFNPIHTPAWKVYKVGVEGLSIFDWLGTNDFTSCYVKNEANLDQVYEAQGVKIIYENHECKLYIFHSVVDNCRCESQCKSAVLLANFLSKSMATVGSLTEFVETAKNAVKLPEVQMEKAKMTLKHFDNGLKSLRVSLLADSRIIC